MQPVETIEELNKRETRFLEVQLWRADQMRKGLPVRDHHSSSEQYTTSDEMDFLNTLSHRNWGHFTKYADLVLNGHRTYGKTTDDIVDAGLVKMHIRNLLYRHNRFED